jgi:hypothetical protein
LKIQNEKFLGEQTHTRLLFFGQLRKVMLAAPLDRFRTQINADGGAVLGRLGPFATDCKRTAEIFSQRQRAAAVAISENAIKKLDFVIRRLH